MPIYAYRCESCGFQQDKLRKLSDPPLTDCPQCGKPTFQKQVTAAGFQLKGSGWYVTDFRDGGSNTGAANKATGKPAPDGTATAAASTSDSSGSAASAGGDNNAGATGSTAAAAPSAPASTSANASSGSTSSSAPSTGSN